ncbi:hypothetical protein ENSA7_44240 [Enhygromyxa salina]|uniref:Uncharacterized protein n=2 Tax=Enhygromyxa salina TaxID=215803 RepID=A0A2S9YKS1_9BACT|nr:hypothetical protein ENSA7_44240 [Enhygromyxa salina]
MVGCGEPPVVDDNEQPKTCLDADAPATEVPDFPLAHQTENLDIYLQDGQFVCAGTANDYQRFVTFVADELATDIQRRIPLYAVQGGSKWCPGVGHGGCVYTDGVVFAQPGVTYHELTHAVACEVRSGVPKMLNEGLAVAYEPVPNSIHGEPTLFSEVDGKFYEYYSLAGHFVRWLHDQLGPDAFRELYRAANYDSGVWNAIEAAYGTSAEADYIAGAPELWVPHRQCADLPLLEPDGDTWNYAARLDCLEPATFGPYERWHPSASTTWGPTSMYQSFLIDIETPGIYQLERPDFDASIHVERCLDEHPTTVDEIDTEWVRDSVWFNFQNIALVEFEHTGLWRVDVLYPHGPPVDVWLTIAPDPG